MKRETYRHPKALDLASRLHCSRPEALGFLTLLFDFTAEVAIAGNIGRWPNGAIAGGCDWRGDADEFVAALIGAGWLDEDAEHRLVVHHWGQHCENWVRAKCQKLGITLLGCNTEPQAPKSSTQEPDLTAGHKSGSFSRDRTEPIQTKPIPTPTHEIWQSVEADLFALGLKAAGGTVTLARDRDFTSERVREAIAFWKQHPEWGPGAIHEHIKQTPHNIPADQGCWPKPTEKAKKQDDHRLKTIFGTYLEKRSTTELKELAHRAGWTLNESECVPSRLSDETRLVLMKQMERDSTTSDRAPNAKPPPPDSSAPKHERTPHGNEASALPSSQSL